MSNTTHTSDVLAAAEDLQAFVNRIAYVRCHMAAAEQATFDKLTGYPHIPTRGNGSDSQLADRLDWVLSGYTDIDTTEHPESLLARCRALIYDESERNPIRTVILPDFFNRDGSINRDRYRAAASGETPTEDAR